MPLSFWFAQGLSVVATIIVFISFQIKNKNVLLLLNVAVNALICAGLFLLEAYLGAAATAVAIVRGFLFFKMEKRPKWYAYFSLALVVALVIVSVIFTYENYFSLLMLAAIFALTYGFWQKNAVFIRVASICASTVFIVYNVFKLAYATIVLESMIILSCVIFLVRLYIEKRKQKNMPDIPPDVPPELGSNTLKND